MPAVLLVDDDELFSELLSIFIVEAGFEPVVARNVPEAITALEQRAELHAAVLDFEVGVGGRGTDVAELVADRFPEAKIIVVSGHRRDHIGTIGERVAFLQKPFDPNELIRIVASATERPDG